MKLATSRRAKLTALALGIAVGSSALAAAPAMAEGSWNSNLSGVLVGKSSRSWQDSHIDSVHTATTFSGCSASPSGFSSTVINLYDEYGALPDQSVGQKTNKCGTSDWGAMTRSDGYHWTIDAINGSQTLYRLSVSSVHQTY